MISSTVDCVLDVCSLQSSVVFTPGYTLSNMTGRTGNPTGSVIHFYLINNTKLDMFKKSKMDGM